MKKHKMKKHKWWHNIINFFYSVEEISGNGRTNQLKFSKICICGKVLNERKQENSFFQHNLEEFRKDTLK